jgi:hypothetical protein
MDAKLVCQIVRVALMGAVGCILLSSFVNVVGIHLWLLRPGLFSLNLKNALAGTTCQCFGQ